MLLRYILILHLIIGAFSYSFAQRNQLISDSAGNSAIENRKSIFPKFFKKYEQVKKQDSLVKKIVYIQQPELGPAFALPDGTIKINVAYFVKIRPNFDDNRLLVVLLHEIGHLNYYQKTPRNLWEPEKSEKAAFEYSLSNAKTLAQKGDCKPLLSALKFMKLRSESNDLQDPHVRALKEVVKESLYLNCKEFAFEKCKI